MNRAHAIREAWHPQTKQDRELILHELEAVLASPHFCNSKRYPTLLQHIVENTLAGKLESLKERTLGVEVFDRPPTYDTNTDTVVRYTAGEVRKRLLLYYSENGSATGIRISLPAGSYVAEFLHGHNGHEELGDDPSHHPGYLHESETYVHPAAETHEAGLNSPDAADETVHPAPAASAAPVRVRSNAGRLAFLAVIALILVAAAAGIWWRGRQAHPLSAVDAFWAPVLRDQHSVVVCTGSVVFAEQHNYSGVTTAGKNIEYPFVSMQIASSIAEISSLLEHFGAGTELVSSATASLPDLREHSVILLGGYNNEWTLRLVQPLRLHFLPGPGEVIADQLQPAAHWQRDESQPYSSADDYALVARYRDPTIDGWVVVLAGVGRNGTEAAAQFATSSHYMQLLKDRVGSDYANRNIEAVLKVKVIDGKTGAPTILDVYSW